MYFKPLRYKLINSATTLAQVYDKIERTKLPFMVAELGLSPSSEARLV